MDYDSPFSSDNKKPKNTKPVHYEEAIDNSTRYDPTVFEVPEEIQRWNWGAFMYNIIWGIGNYTYLPLLCLIPIFNIIWLFVCGLKGNEWAWKSGKFKTVNEFLAVQNTWNRAGVFRFIMVILGFILYALFFSMIIGLLSQYWWYGPRHFY